MVRLRSALLALVVGVACAAMLPAHKAKAWWGPHPYWWGPRIGIYVPVPAPVVVAPRPVYVGPPYVGYYPHRWVPAHWDRWGRWIGGHWI